MTPARPASRGSGCASSAVAGGQPPPAPVDGAGSRTPSRQAGPPALCGGTGCGQTNQRTVPRDPCNASDPPAALVRRSTWPTLQARAAEALSAAASITCFVPSGTLHYQFFDDRDYPYAVQSAVQGLAAADAHSRQLAGLTRRATARSCCSCSRTTTGTWCRPRQAASGSSISTSSRSARPTRPRSTCRRMPRAARSSASRRARSATTFPNNPVPVVDYLEYHRAFKTPYEIAMMREASRIGARAHRAAERAFRAGASEFGIHLGYCQAAGQDANDLPYGNIVALNEHGAVLHYTDLDRLPPKPVRSFLIDAGAQLRRLRLRHHPHLLRRCRRRIPGDGRRGRRRAAGDVRRGARGLRLQAVAPGRAPRAGRHPQGLRRDQGRRRGSRSPAASSAHSSRTASATASACRCTTSPASPPAIAAARFPSRKAIPTCA